MAFDIYGNDLRKGYCEVHPHVHQTYPCSVCLSKKNESSRQSNQIKNNRRSFDPSLGTVRIVIDMLIVRIPKEELSNEFIDVNFDGYYLIQIQNLGNDKWVVTNGMNGYGDNVYEEFKNYNVSILND